MIAPAFQMVGGIHKIHLGTRWDVTPDEGLSFSESDRAARPIFGEIAELLFLWGWLQL